MASAPVLWCPSPSSLSAENSSYGPACGITPTVRRKLSPSRLAIYEDKRNRQVRDFLKSTVFLHTHLKRLAKPHCCAKANISRVKITRRYAWPATKSVKNQTLFVYANGPWEHLRKEKNARKRDNFSLLLTRSWKYSAQTRKRALRACVAA